MKKYNIITKSINNNDDNKSGCGRCGATSTPATTTNTMTNTQQKIQIPKYKKTTRKQCILLNLVWERNWPKVISRIKTSPEEIFSITTDWGRTALHFAMFNQGCPLYVATALLEANEHSTIIQDFSGYTPLHYACMFASGNGGGGTTDLIPLLCKTVIHVENNYIGCQNPITNENYKEEPQSPLYLACKRNAPIKTIHILLQSVKYDHQNQEENNISSVIGLWIAPSTGAEPYYDDHRTDDNDDSVLLPSPLAELWKQRTYIPHMDDEIKIKMKQIASDIIMSKQTRKTSSSSSNSDGDDGDDDDVVSFLDLWRKSISLIVEEYYRRCHHRCHHKTIMNYDDRVKNDSDGEIKLLHAVTVLRIPIPLFLQAVAQVYPEQAMQRDKDCNLIPLHHIFRLVRLKITSKPITIHVMFTCILQANTNAAAIPCCIMSDEENNSKKYNKFPLIMAIELQMNWRLIIKTLIQAKPRALKKL